MPTDPTIKFGILKCRDLVQLYYGARLVVSITETTFQVPIANPIQILGQDPRRIRYEVNYYNLSGVGAYLGYGSAAAIDEGTNEFISIPSNVSGQFERVWLTDQEGVCLAVWAQSTDGEIGVSIRETFLTPAPVDEGP